MEEAIELLNKMYIKEHFEGENEIIKISKKELIKFSIKLLNTIKNNL